jgi:hypothetical protein
VAAPAPSHAPGGERRRLGRVLRRSLRALESWARQNAELDHMARALRAEHARLRGRRADALALYARAAERAASGGYRHHAALLHERRAELLLSMQRPVEGASALQQALSLYDAWGASRKVEELRVRIAGLR